MMFVNMRNAMLSGGKRKPTARDYVQDGLIAMWDGIENAGWGVHDPNATTWKDLTGMALNTLYLNNCTWSNNALLLNGSSSGAQLPGNRRIPPNSAEVVFTAERSGNQFVFNSGDENYRCVQQGDGINCGNIQIPKSFASFPITYSVSHVGVSAYLNGAEVDTVTSQNWNFTGYRVEIGRRYSGGANYFKGKVHALRLYSRTLTASEIAANYAIDKARFNLPDAT